jgi:hypothetical protein
MRDGPAFSSFFFSAMMVGVNFSDDPQFRKGL